MPANSNVWVATKSTTNGNGPWECINGVTSYVKWALNEPSYDSGGPDCVEMGVPQQGFASYSKMMTASCDSARTCACEQCQPGEYSTSTSCVAYQPTGYPTSFPTPSPSSPGSCFHGDGALILKSGEIKKFSELSLGDEIKTSNGLGGFTYSSILTLPHKNNTEPALFVTLITESGKKLDLTSDHFIPKCDQTQVTAAELVVGDCLLTIDGKETLVEVSSEAKNGVFTAITKDKYIVVDGVVASPFSKNTDPMKPELDYEKYRMELEEKRARRVSAQVSELQKKAVGHTSN